MLVPLALSAGSDWGGSFWTGWGTYASSTRDRTTGLGYYSRHDIKTESADDSMEVRCAGTLELERSNRRDIPR
jgi:hypothetical protein